MQYAPNPAARYVGEPTQAYFEDRQARRKRLLPEARAQIAKRYPDALPHIADGMARALVEYDIDDEVRAEARAAKVSAAEQAPVVFTERDPSGFYKDAA